jgi:hypothetical protein
VNAPTAWRAENMRGIERLVKRWKRAEFARPESTNEAAAKQYPLVARVRRDGDCRRRATPLRIFRVQLFMSLFSAAESSMCVSSREDHWVREIRVARTRGSRNEFDSTQSGLRRLPTRASPPNA